MDVLVDCESLIHFPTESKVFGTVFAPPPKPVLKEFDALVAELTVIDADEAVEARSMPPILTQTPSTRQLSVISPSSSFSVSLNTTVSYMFSCHFAV